MAARLKFYAGRLMRGVLTSVIAPVLRPVLWHMIFHDIARQPILLRYIKVRTSLLDRFGELFPDAQECSSRIAVHDAAVQAALASGVQGLWMEFGVWNGKSINHIARQVRGTVYGFDSFEGLPVDWWQGTTSDALVKKDHFKIYGLPRVRSNVELVKGWFDKTLPPFLQAHPEPAAFIHIDSDVYESAKVVLDVLASRIVPGTVILFDELYNYPEWEVHEYKALQEFLAATGRKVRYLAFNSAGEQVALQVI